MTAPGVQAIDGHPLTFAELLIEVAPVGGEVGGVAKRGIIDK
jgi:hypothetical protein